MNKKCWAMHFVAVWVWAFLVAADIHAAAGVERHAEDIQAIDILRSKLEKSFVSARPDAVGELIADDFVYLQKNSEGPSVYGKKYFLDYLPSLDPIVKMKIKPLSEVEVFGDWAVERGEVHMGVMMGGEVVSQVARYLKILNREPAGWKYAREITGMAENLKSHKVPPRPGFITYAGNANWEPRVSPDPVDEMDVVEKECRRNMVEQRDIANAVLECQWAHKEDALYILPQGVATWKQYVGMRHAHARQPYDEHEKYYKEMIVDGDFGFAWGHSVTTAVYLDTGARRAGVNQILYVYRKDESGVFKFYYGFGTRIAESEPYSL